MKVLWFRFCLAFGWRFIVVRMGRWSDESSVSVVHVVLECSVIGIIVRSGEVGCC